jgi:hypothetical protein
VVVHASIKSNDKWTNEIRLLESHSSSVDILDSHYFVRFVFLLAMLLLCGFHDVKWFALFFMPGTQNRETSQPVNKRQKSPCNQHRNTSELRYSLCCASTVARGLALKPNENYSTTI